VLAVLSVLLLILPLDNTVPDVAFRNPARDLHATAGAAADRLPVQP
jgi:hypothetical protein